MMGFYGNQKKRLSYRELEEAYEKARNELSMLSEITAVTMQSLDPEQVLYSILTALTSHEGLGFNRAMFFLVNEKDRTLEGKMGIGPSSAEDADKIWQHINTSNISLQNLVNYYNKSRKPPFSELDNLVRSISIPLLEESGILALTVLEGMPFNIENSGPGSKVNKNIKDILKLDAFVTVPLKTRNGTIGLILVDNIFSAKRITDDNIRILNTFAGHAALAIENSRLYEQTVHLSRTDWLTGLWNTRHFHKAFDDYLIKSAFDNTELSLLMIDIDNFKKFNDSMGHPAGNSAIKRVAEILKTYSGKTDFVCRYGGEEFSIIITGTGSKMSEKTAENLRSEVELSFKNDPSIPNGNKLTISTGIASFPHHSREKNNLIKKADLALYHAKHTGKNKICLYSDDLTK